MQVTFRSCHFYFPVIHLISSQTLSLAFKSLYNSFRTPLPLQLFLSQTFPPLR